MRKIIIVLFVLISAGAMAQEDQWINRVNFNTTEDCIDSVTCYTDVVIDVNLLAVPDSAMITVIIGSTPGANDILNKQYQNLPTLFALPEIQQGENNVAIISVGKYIVGESFFVDTFIE